MNTTLDVAYAFVAMLEAGDHEGAAKTFNHPDIVSIEPVAGEHARVAGKEAVAAKGAAWMAAHTVHEFEVEGPYVNGDQFICIFTGDVTEKATGERMEFAEIAVYTVKDGLIIEERFFEDQVDDEEDDEDEEEEDDEDEDEDEEA